MREATKIQVKFEDNTIEIFNSIKECVKKYFKGLRSYECKISKMCSNTIKRKNLLLLDGRTVSFKYYKE